MATRAVAADEATHRVRRRTSHVAAAATDQRAAPTTGARSAASSCLLTTSITATTVAHALEELSEAAAAGADVVELRLDFLEQFEPANDLPALLAATSLPAIVTYRASWEGGKYAGPEDARLRTLWLAVELGAAFVDVELKAAARFFAAAPQGWSRDTARTRIIVSSHNYAETPSLEDLGALHGAMLAAGTDIVKIATTATRLVDVARLEALLSQSRNVPTIALGMGEAGLVRVCAMQTRAHEHRVYVLLTARYTGIRTQVSRLLAPKFGAFLTFGALRAGKESAPGQPTLAQLLQTYRLHGQVRMRGVPGADARGA
jgi:3-dehydroquinate dehydratase/shikimate dehydrogenase